MLQLFFPCLTKKKKKEKEEDDDEENNSNQTQNQYTGPDERDCHVIRDVRKFTDIISLVTHSKDTRRVAGVSCPCVRECVCVTSSLSMRQYFTPLASLRSKRPTWARMSSV